MPRLIRRRPLHWGAIAGAAGALLAVVALAGCPGDIDPSIKMPSQGGTGGSGSGTGGSSADCSGANAGDQIITSTCAIGGCHNASTSPSLNGGLNLTVDSGIATRLVGVMSGANGASMCRGSLAAPYLDDNSNPATGLLIDKLKPNPSCGVQMPEVPPYLTANQLACVIQWATTLTTQ